MSDRMDEIRSTRAPRLRTDQIEILKRYGEIRKTEVGEVLFRAGDTDNDFMVVLEGEVKVGDDFPGESRFAGSGPKRWPPGRCAGREARPYLALSWVVKTRENLGKEHMLKTILITGTIGMIVGFGGTLMSLFGGGSLLMEYLEFVVMLVLFLVMLIGAYWFVMVNPAKDDKKSPTP